MHLIVLDLIINFIILSSFLNILLFLLLLLFFWFFYFHIEILIDLISELVISHVHIWKLLPQVFGFLMHRKFPIEIFLVWNWRDSFTKPLCKFDVFLIDLFQLPMAINIITPTNRIAILIFFFYYILTLLYYHFALVLYFALNHLSWWWLKSV